MRDEIRYIPLDIILDLSEPGLGHPDGRRIVEAHHNDCHKNNVVFECLDHRTGTNPGMYLQLRGDQWWAVHFEASACGSKRIAAPMSDEHKRQAEYWVRAATSAGLRAETEFTLPTRTRPDVLIYGPINTGVEVQRSGLSRARAIDRTRRAALAGVSDIWSTDRSKPPYWLHHVPTVTENPDAWHYLRRERIMAGGVREVEAVRCMGGNLPRCPSGYQFCGKFHAKSVPVVVSIDDLAWRVPTGDIVALDLPAITGTTAGVYLCTARSAALYTELTGQPAPNYFRPGTEPQRHQKDPGRVECRNVQPTFKPISCGACELRFFTSAQFRDHQVIGYDGRPICPESPSRYPLARRR
jgi:hypothetical protein